MWKILKFIGCMTKLDKRILNSQIEVFLSWVKRNNTGTERNREWLDLFFRHCYKADILDVNDDDVENFLKIVYDRESSAYRRHEARKAVFCLRKFYMARSKNGRAKMGRGRPPALEQYERVGELKKENPGLSFAQIGILLNPKKPVDRSLTYHWWQRFLKLKKG